VWFNILSLIVTSFIAIISATWFSSRQNSKVLKQNLRIKIYELFWNSIQDVSNSLAVLPTKATLGLDFLKNSIDSHANFGESQADFDSRRRSLISSWVKEYDESLDEIQKYQIRLHQLWEQYEPVIHNLNIAFRTYIEESRKITDVRLNPVVSPWDLDITDFDKIYKPLRNQNEELTRNAMSLLVYGIDLGRMLQEELIAEHFDFIPIHRGEGAQEGYELTRTGLVPVKVFSGLRKITS
jgi:hypothetical protein